MSVVHAETIHVFLLGGQSNADGLGELAGLPANLAGQQEDIPFYYATTTGPREATFKNFGLTKLEPGHTSRGGLLGPEVTFGRSMADFYGAQGESIAVIKYANGGTSLMTNWTPGGDATTTGDAAIYQTFQTAVTDGMAAIQAAYPTATLTINGMIWMQGERDARADWSDLYQMNLSNFITDIRLTYGTDLPFVIGRLSSGQTGTGSATYRDTVRAAQSTVAAADPFTGLVDTDSFGLNSDALHFSTAGQMALGYEFASQMQTLVSVPEPSSLALFAIASGLIGFRYCRRRR